MARVRIGRTLVHLGFNQVFVFFVFVEYFLDCMFCTVKTCLQFFLLLVILFWNFIEHIFGMFFLLFWNDPDNYLMCVWIVQFIQLVQYP